MSRSGAIAVAVVVVVGDGAGGVDKEKYGFR